MPNTLRFYRWNPSVVSIGYFQSMKNEVDIQACDKRKIDYIRRITGGGAVYHDTNGELKNIRKYLVAGKPTKQNPKFTGVRGHNDN